MGKRIIVVMAALAVVGCSATRLVYQRLDWLMAWRLHDYVSLNVAQKAEFKRDFSGIWQWHRSHELPLYARDLREMAAGLGSPATPEQVASYSAHFEESWERLMEKTVSGVCDVVRSLDDAQAREILDGVDDDIVKFTEEYVRPSPEELRRNSEKRSAKWVRRWTGPLNPRQQELLHRWGGERRALGAAWLEQRRQWRQQLEQTLRQRSATPDCAQFRPLFVTPLATARKVLADDLAYNEALWNHLIADMVNAMDARQHKYARGELLDFAAELEELAATPAP